MSTWELPGYAVQEMLGFGATGEVWRARCVATGETVALKRLRAGADPAAVRALRREAELLAGLDTPYVVRLRDVLRVPDVGDVLVLDHAAGGSLAALLSRRGSLDPGELVTVAAPVAQALAAAHAAGLVHGDVSAANVLFTAEGMPLLSDLGTARLLGDAGLPGGHGLLGGGLLGGGLLGGGLLGDAEAVAVTPEYVDPAVAAGGAPTPASDVWALGAVCHHVLAGTPPRDGAPPAELLARAATGDRAPLGLLAPAAPRSLVAVVEAALDADPDRRPTAEAFADRLQRAHPPAPVRLRGAPAAAPVPPAGQTTEVPRPRPPAEPLARRRRVPLVAGGAAVLVLALLVAGLVWALGGRAGTPAVLDALPEGLMEAGAELSTAPRAGSPGPSVDAGAGGATGAGDVVGAPSTAPGPPGPSGGAGVEGAGGPGAGVAAGAAAGAGAGAGGPGADGSTAGAPAAGATGPPAGGGPLGGPGGPAAPDWQQVLDRLDAQRADAFARGDPTLLGTVYAAGAPPAAVDAAALAALQAAGRTAAGVRHELRQVEPLTLEASRAVFRVVDVLAPHELRGPGAALAEARPGRGEQPYEVELVREGGAWVIARLTPL